MTKPKICKDCKHFDKPQPLEGFNNYALIELYATCKRARVVTTNSISGRETNYFRRCMDERRGNCGKKAKYFEAKE